MVNRKKAYWDTYAKKVHGFKTEEEMYRYFLRDFTLMCIKRILNFTGIENRIKKYGLKYIIKKRGGPNGTHAAKMRWYYRAQALNFLNEREMLKAYMYQSNKLFNTILPMITKYEKTTIVLNTLIVRYKKYKIPHLPEKILALETIVRRIEKTNEK